MSEEKTKKLVATIESTRKSLSRVIDYLNDDCDTSIFEIREVQCRLNAAMMAIKELRCNETDFSLRNVIFNDLSLRDVAN